jgi:hypothetical protein
MHSHGKANKTPRWWMKGLVRSVAATATAVVVLLLPATTTTAVAVATVQHDRADNYTTNFSSDTTRSSNSSSSSILSLGGLEGGAGVALCVNVTSSPGNWVTEFADL